MWYLKVGIGIMFDFLKKFNKNKEKNNFGEARATILDIKNFRVVESYKQLRTNIMFAMSAKDTHVVSLSSSFPGEGKSVTSANIAIATAQTGARVVLIDCDLRRPVQNKIFSLENKKGLSSVLGRMEKIDDVINKNVVDNMDVITSGPMPPNPSELIVSKNMEEFIKEVDKRYDYVIIDTPPINVVTDALELSKYTGGLVIVTRQGITTYEDVKRTLHSAKLIEVPILGFVVNGIKESKFNGYGYKHRYGYKYKYSDYEYKTEV